MKKNKIIAIFAIVTVFLAVIINYILNTSFATALTNDVRVEEETELVYYLNVNYNGVDKYGVASTDTQVSSVESGIIQVSDKIPDGLIFDEFVTTSTGGIGSVKRSDSSYTCSGTVVDDTNEDDNEGVWNEDNTEFTYHGLHYDARTRLVSFKVKNLQAGCVLTVGIKTMTPTVDDPETPFVEVRRDFYNFATARENDLTVKSNTVHAYMGGDTGVYTITYQYCASAPSNVPSLTPNELSAAGSTIRVRDNINIEGYRFTGWSSNDVTIEDDKFIMPANNVIIMGCFEELQKHNVKYEIIGEVPNGYLVPIEKSYYEGTHVKVDSLKAGDVVNGYRFLGWETDDVELIDNTDFMVADKDITFKGRFEVMTYKVTYYFYDDPLPPNSEDLLPETSEYREGDSVTLASIVDPEGYKFLGWYSEDTFTMPAHDVDIYGEWMVVAGTFAPNISKRVVNDIYYKPGDEVLFEISVENTADFAITDVILNENTPNAKFINLENYDETSTEEILVIPSIGAHETVKVYSIYTVDGSEGDKIVNEVELIGALANNNYYLEDKEYKATAEAKVAVKLTICKKTTDVSTNKKFQFQIAGNQYETWLIMKKDECKSVYLNEGDFKVLEIIPQEYSLTGVTGSISSNGAVLNVSSGNEYKITFTNKFTQKGFYHSTGRAENKITLGGN